MADDYLMSIVISLDIPINNKNDNIKKNEVQDIS